MQIQLLGNIPDMPWDACDDDGVASLKDIPPIPFITSSSKDSTHKDSHLLNTHYK